MKSDFLLAITQLSAEKNLPKEVVLEAVETALISVYRKDNFSADQNIRVKIEPTSGQVRVWAEKTVAKRPSDIGSEISLTQARRVKPDTQIGETVMVEATPHNAGRIAAQTAKQVILQRLHEAEHSAILEEFSGREGDIVTGIVQRIEPRQLLIDLGRTEGILPWIEQVPNERYRVGQRLKVVILEVAQTSGGPRVILSRSHPNLLRRLFEMEVPEFSNGVIEIKSVAREAGSRCKVAVTSRQENVDPVGCCVGLRGIRIQNIVNELHGEKIDVVLWSADITTFIASALSPAQILSVESHKEENIATVVVPDRQLSLAIGREGQNVRLAAKLTGWRIDIKGASIAEAEEAAMAKKDAIASEEAPAVLEPVLTSAETITPTPPLDSTLLPPLVPMGTSSAAKQPGLRFAEDIMGPGPSKPPSKSRKKQKKDIGDRDGADGGRGRKARLELNVPLDEEEY
ncbi:MAG: transcription termination factor NusA [Dehalococcoidales bacterium]|jgi:N utilization substance protein A|nr:transcription termination factor NusA [Dehalococcoidales bacterium]MDP6738034.1 transcription termination factor NusA [Dehalococcoidales bacterium]